METKVTFVDGLQFVGEGSSGHAIVLDGVPEFGGHDSGLRPRELLLIALGGCTGMDAVSILKKKKQNFTGFEVNVRGATADSHPKKFTSITVEYIVRGKDLSEEAVKRACGLSMEKYCAVKATLEGGVDINYTYKIVEE